MNELNKDAVLSYLVEFKKKNRLNKKHLTDKTRVTNG